MSGEIGDEGDVGDTSDSGDTLWPVQLRGSAVLTVAGASSAWQVWLRRSFDPV